MCNNFIIPRLGEYLIFLWRKKNLVKVKIRSQNEFGRPYFQNWKDTSLYFQYLVCFSSASPLNLLVLHHHPIPVQPPTLLHWYTMMHTMELRYRANYGGGEEECAGAGNSKVLGENKWSLSCGAWVGRNRDENFSSCLLLINYRRFIRAQLLSDDSQVAHQRSRLFTLFLLSCDCTGTISTWAVLAQIIEGGIEEYIILNKQNILLT